MAARGFLGAGDLYIDRYSGGSLTGVEGPFECRKFEIKPNVELKELTSKGKTTYGQVIETAAIPQPFDLTIDLGEVNKAGLALALFGTIEALTQSSGTVTNEAVTADHDKWITLSKVRVSSVVVTNTGGGTTYVNGTDYLANLEMGWVKVLSTGAITDNQALHIDFAYAAISGDKILGGTQAQIRARFYLDGKNFADDAPHKVTVYEAVIAADSAVDLLADDFNAISLPGRMKTPTGYTEPFLIELRNVAA